METTAPKKREKEGGREGGNGRREKESMTGEEQGERDMASDDVMEIER